MVVERKSPKSCPTKRESYKSGKDSRNPNELEQYKFTNKEVKYDVREAKCKALNDLNKIQKMGERLYTKLHNQGKGKLGISMK